MRQSTFDATSIQHGVEQPEKSGLMPQGGDVALNLSRRLDNFRRTPPYKEKSYAQQTNQEK